jgi:CheY-like chemotaxis protein/nitrogen-specific signal transduction histidine kinase
VKFENNIVKELLGDQSIFALEENSSLPGQLNVINEVRRFMVDDLSEKSFGVMVIRSKQFECRAHKLKWGHETCCMITIKDVSTILNLERISAENKMKNLIIRSISHELRTPINCINLISDELLKRFEKEAQDKVQAIKTCTKLLTYQINDILDYSDLTAGRFIAYKSEMNLKEDLRTCLDTIRFQAVYKKVRIFSKIDTLLPERVITDAYRIQKVVVNLLTNALKYTSLGKIKLYARTEGCQIVIGVKDTGVGIPEERKKQLLSMLSDTSSTGINGLSLHVCQKILENFNSSLSFTSILGHGSDFSFKIDLPTTRHRRTNSKSLKSLSIDPMSDDEIEIPCESASCCDFRQLNFKSFERNPTRIMIVDDNELNRMCLGNLLKGEGIEFIEAVNGQMAVDKVIGCDKMRSPLKCIIMDLSMPVMDGWEASRLISQLYSQGKISRFPAIIAHTAYSSQEDISKCYESGMVSYISKPSTHETILTIIKKYI